MILANSYLNEEFLSAFQSFINTRDNRGQSALHLACKASMRDGQTILHRPWTANFTPQASRNVRLLCKYGASLYLQDNRGYTPMDWAHYSIIPDMIEECDYFPAPRILNKIKFTSFLSLDSNHFNRRIMSYVIDYLLDLGLEYNETTSPFKELIRDMYCGQYYVIEEFRIRMHILEKSDISESENFESLMLEQLASTPVDNEYIRVCIEDYRQMKPFHSAAIQCLRSVDPNRSLVFLYNECVYNLYTNIMNVVAFNVLCHSYKLRLRELFLSAEIPLPIEVTNIISSYVTTRSAMISVCSLYESMFSNVKDVTYIIEHEDINFVKPPKIRRLC